MRSWKKWLQTYLQCCLSNQYTTRLFLFFLWESVCAYQSDSFVFHSKVFKRASIERIRIFSADIDFSYLSFRQWWWSSSDAKSNNVSNDVCWRQDTNNNKCINLWTSQALLILNDIFFSKYISFNVRCVVTLHARLIQLFLTFLVTICTVRRMHCYWLWSQSTKTKSKRGKDNKIVKKEERGRERWTEEKKNYNNNDVERCVMHKHI